MQNFARRGRDVVVYEWVRVLAADRISFGDHVIVDDFVMLQGGTGVEIGSWVHIASFASITGGGAARIGDFATISSGVRLFTGTDVPDGSGLVNSTIPADLRSVTRSSVTLGDHAFVGANSVVLPGVTVGEGAVVGAGSLVRADLEPWTIYAGSPARPLRERPRDRVLEAAADLQARDA